MGNSTEEESNSTNNVVFPCFNRSHGNKSSNEPFCREFEIIKNKVASDIVGGSISLFGSVGNILVILVICRTPHLRNICGFLIVNLAVADFIASAFAIPIFFYALSHTKHCFGSHNTLILVGIGLTLISVAASIGTLVSLSVDRSFAICCPLKHKTFMTFTKLKVKIVSIWLACTTLSIWCVVRLGAAEDVHLISSLFILCFLIIITSGVVTVLHLRKNSSRVSKLHQNQGGGQMSVTMRQRNQQVAKTVGIVVMFFCLSWSPFVVFMILNPFDYSLTRFWLNCLGLANSAMNPCIYFYRHRNYREALKATFHC